MVLKEVAQKRWKNTNLLLSLVHSYTYNKYNKKIPCLTWFENIAERRL